MNSKPASAERRLATAAAALVLAAHAGTLQAQTEAETAPADAPLAADSPPAAAAEAAAPAAAEASAPDAPSATPEAAPISDTIPVAVAEPAPSPDAKAKPTNRFIEEVVVTAQKREENLQDVPISVQAFSADLLDAKGITEPKALQLTTPGLQYNVFAGYSLIYIRGIGTEAFIPSADASVATYIDNVYYPFGHSLASSLGAIERVEVLKGPQGTLFGRNSTGGAINIVTRQPGPDAETNVLVSQESYNKTNFRAYTNIPLTDSFAFSISGLSYTEDNYYKLAPSSPRDALPEETSNGFSVKGGWTPIDNLEAVLGYTYLNSRGSQAMGLAVGDVKPAGLALGVSRSPDYQTGEDAPTYVDTRSRVITGDIKYSTSLVDLRLIGGHQDIISPALADYDGSARPLTTFEAKGQFAKVKTAEFQIISNADSPGADWLQYIGGVYHIDSSAGYDPLLFSAAPNVLQFFANPPSDGPLGVLAGLTNPLITGLSDIADATGIPLDDIINGGATLNLQGVLDTKSTAFFAQATAKLTDELSLTLGGRYQTEKRTLAKSTTRYVPNAGNFDQVVPVFDFNTPLFGQDGPPSRKNSNFAPKAVLDYKPDDDQLFYASYSTGFKSGTYNIIAIYAPTQYIKPEKVTSYELGYKSTLLDGALRFNAAAFFNKIRDLQVQTISLTSGGAVRFETAGSAEIKGVDFDITWQVAPDALPGLVVTAGSAFLDGKYTSYKEGSGFDEVTGIFFDGTIFPTRDFTGNKLVRTPDFSGNAGLAYSFEIGDSTLEAAGDVYYNDGSFFSAQNLSTSKENSYHVINARASYVYNPWDMRVTVFGRNLNKAKYHYVISELDFGTARVLAPPDTYGVKLQWSF